MKKWMILLYLLIAGITNSIPVQAKDAKQELLKILHTTGHDTLRLNTLRELTNVTKGQPEVRKYYINELLKEAEQQNNDTFRCYAFLYHIFVHYNNFNKEGVNQWLQKVEPLARKIGRYDLMFQAQQCAIDLEIADGKFEQGIQKGRAMLKEAQQLKNTEGIIMSHQCLATAYRSSYQLKEAADEFEKAYALAKTIDNYQMEMEITTLLASTYKRIGDNANWLKYLTLKEKKVQESIRKYPQRKEALRGELLTSYINYITYYVRTDKPEMAAKYMQLASEYYSDEYYIYKLMYHQQRSSYYIYTHKPDKAVEELDQILPILKKVYYTDYCAGLSMKASLLLQQGHYTEALRLNEEVLHGKDSLQISIYSKQIEQLKQDYDTNQMILEKARIHKYMQLGFLLLVIIVIGMLTWFALNNWYISKRLAKAEKRMKLISENVAQANKAKERFLSNISYAIRVPLKSVVSQSLLLASEKEISTQEREEASKSISRTSAELMKLINDILDLSRLEAGKMKFKIGPIDVNAYLHDAIAIAAAKYKIKIESSLPESKVYTSQTDGSRFLDMMGSLLVPEKGDEELIVTVEKVPDEELLRISVTNPLLAADNQTQETTIRNEINRMMIEHLGGSYVLKQNQICFTMRLCQGY